MHMIDNNHSLLLQRDKIYSAQRLPQTKCNLFLYCTKSPQFSNNNWSFVMMCEKYYNMKIKIVRKRLISLTNGTLSHKYRHKHTYNIKENVVGNHIFQDKKKWQSSAGTRIISDHEMIIPLHQNEREKEMKVV